MAEEHGGGGVVRELLAIFGFEVDDKDLKKGENALEHFLEKAKHVAEGIAAAFAVEAIFEFAEAQVHAMTAVEHLAAQVGLSAEQVQEWQFAARASGFEADRFVTAMSRLQVAQGAALSGNKQAAATFSSLGIHVKDASGHAKTADALFSDVAEAIKGTEDPAKRAQIATKLFGRSGRELLPILREGKEGLDELAAGYREAGGGYTEEAMESSKKFEKQQAKTTQAMTAFKNVVSIALLPVVTKLSQWAAGAIKWFAQLTSDTNVFQAALVVLGVAGAAFAVQMAIAFAPLFLIAGALAAVVLLIDDIITTFQGGDSVIRRGIDAVFGEGKTDEAIRAIRRAWEEVSEAVKEAYQWAKKHGEEVKTIISYLPPVLLARGARAVYRGVKEWSSEGPEISEDEAMKDPFLAAQLHPKAAPGALQSLPGANMSMSVGDVTINQSLPAGLDPRQTGVETKKAVHEALKELHREAAARLHRAPAAVSGQ